MGQGGGGGGLQSGAEQVVAEIQQLNNQCGALTPEARQLVWNTISLNFSRLFSKR